MELDLQALVEAVSAALALPEVERNTALDQALDGVHPADIAEIMQQLPRPEALEVFNWLSIELAAEVADELDRELMKFLVESAAPGRIAELLDLLPMDDAAELIHEAGIERGEELLESLDALAPVDADEIRELLAYAQHSAGRMMTDKFVRVGADMTMRDVFRILRKQSESVETLNSIYVVESLDPLSPGYSKLVGVFSLRDLLSSKRSQSVADIMTTELITVDVDTDQEEVARIMSRYDLLALPVLERDGRIAGIITVDDVLDILQAEATEDMLRLGAVAGDDRPYLSVGVLANFRHRIGWLMLLFVGQFLTLAVLENFQHTLDDVVMLAIFVPLLIGSAGNAGAQTVMTITRALALGEVGFRHTLRIWWREARTGALLGLALAVFGYYRAVWMDAGTKIAWVVGISLVVVVAWAAMVGALLPIGAKRLGLDPAVVSAPLITTLVDATGLLFYFLIASYFLGL